MTIPPTQIPRKHNIRAFSQSYTVTGHLIQQSVGDYDLTSGLSKISAPTLIVQGVADPLDPSMAAKTQAAIPNAKLTALANCGHFAWVEAPEKLSPLLSDFLADK